MSSRGRDAEEIDGAVAVWKAGLDHKFRARADELKAQMLRAAAAGKSAVAGMGSRKKARKKKPYALLVPQSTKQSSTNAAGARRAKASSRIGKRSTAAPTVAAAAGGGGGGGAGDSATGTTARRRKERRASAEHSPGQGGASSSVPEDASSGDRSSAPAQLEALEAANAPPRRGRNQEEDAGRADGRRHKVPPHVHSQSQGAGFRAVRATSVASQPGLTEREIMARRRAKNHRQLVDLQRTTNSPLPNSSSSAYSSGRPGSPVFLPGPILADQIERNRTAAANNGRASGFKGSKGHAVAPSSDVQSGSRIGRPSPTSPASRKPAPLPKFNKALGHFLSRGLALMQIAEEKRSEHVAAVRPELQEALFGQQAVQREFASGIVERMLDIAKTYTSKFDNQGQGQPAKLPSHAADETTSADDDQPPSEDTKLSLSAKREAELVNEATTVALAAARQPLLAWLPTVFNFLPLADMLSCSRLCSFSHMACQAWMPLALVQRRVDFLSKFRFPSLEQQAHDQGDESFETLPVAHHHGVPKARDRIIGFYPNGYTRNFSGLVNDCARLIGRDASFSRRSSSQSNQDAEGRQSRSPTHSPKPSRSGSLADIRTGTSSRQQGAAFQKRQSTPQKEQTQLRPLRSHGRGRKAPPGTLPDASKSGFETGPVNGSLFGPGIFGSSILDDEPPLDVAANPWLFMVAPPEHAARARAKLSAKDERFFVNLREYIKETLVAAAAASERVEAHAEQQNLDLAQGQLTNQGHIGAQERRAQEAQQRLSKKEEAAKRSAKEQEAKRTAYHDALPENSPERLTLDFFTLYAQLCQLSQAQEPQFVAWHAFAEAEYQWRFASDEERTTILQHRMQAEEAVAAMQVTKVAHGALGRREALQRRVAVATIQRFARGVISRARERAAALKIQSIARGNAARKRVELMQISASKVTHKFRERFVTKAALTLVKVRRFFRRCRSALRIQAAYRAHLAQEEAIQRFSAMVTLQRFSRQRLLRKEKERWQEAVAAGFAQADKHAAN